MYPWLLDGLQSWATGFSSQSFVWRSFQIHLALNSQCLDSYELPVRIRDDPVLYPGIIPRNRVHPHIVAFACLSYRIHQVRVLTFPVPIGRIANLHVCAVRIPVVDQLREVNCF